MSLSGVNKAMMNYLLLSSAHNRAMTLDEIKIDMNKVTERLYDEMKFDEARGLDIAKKAENLEERVQKSEDITAAIVEICQDIVGIMTPDNEEPTEEEQGENIEDIQTYTSEAIPIPKQNSNQYVDIKT